MPTMSDDPKDALSKLFEGLTPEPTPEKKPAKVAPKPKPAKAVDIPILLRAAADIFDVTPSGNALSFETHKAAFEAAKVHFGKEGAGAEIVTTIGGCLELKGGGDPMMRMFGGKPRLALGAEAARRLRAVADFVERVLATSEAKQYLN